MMSFILVLFAICVLLWAVNKFSAVASGPRCLRCARNGADVRMKLERYPEVQWRCPGCGLRGHEQERRERRDGGAS